ncbi:MAG: GNAT family N-acetyltransferase [Candidatus Berkiellales bacterium]
MTIKTRKVAIQDIKELMPLIQQLGYSTTEENLIARISLYQHGTNERAWVALEDDSIVGCVAIHVYDLFHSTDRFGRIVSLIVKDTHRRLGIGRRLLLRAERFASIKNCTAIELTSSVKRHKFGTHKFYASLGYHNEGEYKTTYLRKYLQIKDGPHI